MLPARADFPGIGREPSVANLTELQAASSFSFPFGVWRLTYGNGNGAPPLFYQPSNSACSLNAGAGDNGSQVQSADGKCWLAQFPGQVDVREFGADPSGVADSAPACRAMFALGSNHVFLFPPGSYLIASTMQSPYPLVTGGIGCGLFGNSTAHYHDITVYAYGAQFFTAAATANIDYFSFAWIDHFHWYGFEPVANPANWVPNSEPTGMLLFNIDEGRFQDVAPVGNWGGSTKNPVIFAADNLTDVVFDHLTMPQQGQCFDLAYLKRVTFQNIFAVGSDDAGTSGSRSTCFGIQYDGATVADYGGVSGTGSISGTTLTITSTSGGNWFVGEKITGAGVPANTYITALGTGTGGTGTYVLNNVASVSGTITGDSLAPYTTVSDVTIAPSVNVSGFALGYFIATGGPWTVEGNFHDNTAVVGTFTGSISGTTLTATAIATGTLFAGAFVTGSGVAANTQITSVGTCGGIAPTLPCTATVNTSQTVGSESMTATYGGGLGGLLRNQVGGINSSTNDPLHDLRIGGTYSNNGNSELPIGGIEIDGSQTNSGEKISRVLIANANFYNNTNTGVTTFTGPGLLAGSLTVATLACSGAAQATCANAGTLQSQSGTAWTPVDNSGAGLSFASASASYNIVGNIVFARVSLNYPSTSNGSPAAIAGLPVNAASPLYGYDPEICTSNGAATVLARVSSAGNGFALYNATTMANLTNANLSGTALQCSFKYPIN